MTTVAEFAAEKGISSVRARALAETSQLPAHKVGRVWLIDDAAREWQPKVARPLSPTNQAALLNVIDANGDLSGVRAVGARPDRVGKLVAKLRTAENPAELIRAWFPAPGRLDQAPQTEAMGGSAGSGGVKRRSHRRSKVNPGAQIVAAAQAHRDDTVRELVNIWLPHTSRKFIPTVERLAQVVSNERLARGFTVAEVACLAHLDELAVRDVEQVHPRLTLGRVRRLLDVVGVEPLALPNLPIESII